MYISYLVTLSYVTLFQVKSLCSQVYASFGQKTRGLFTRVLRGRRWWRVGEIGIPFDPWNPQLRDFSFTPLCPDDVECGGRDQDKEKYVNFTRSRESSDNWLNCRTWSPGLSDGEKRPRTTEGSNGMAIKVGIGTWIVYRTKS